MSAQLKEVDSSTISRLNAEGGNIKDIVSHVLGSKGGAVAAQYRKVNKTVLWIAIGLLVLTVVSAVIIFPNPSLTSISGRYAPVMIPFLFLACAIVLFVTYHRNASRRAQLSNVGVSPDLFESLEKRYHNVDGDVAQINRQLFHEKAYILMQIVFQSGRLGPFTFLTEDWLFGIIGLKAEFVKLASIIGACAFNDVDLHDGSNLPSLAVGLDSHEVVVFRINEALDDATIEELKKRIPKLQVGEKIQLSDGAQLDLTTSK